MVSRSEQPSELDLTPIQKQVIDAVKVMFARAIEHGIDDPSVLDRKKELEEGLNPSGPLQDCEFGMILLLVRDWLGNDFFEILSRSEFDAVVKALLKRTVRRVLVRMRNDEGGGDDSHPAFFTGDPYTRYRIDGNIRYSANLDAAMITLAFLAPAVELLNDQLVNVDHEIKPTEAELPQWVQNLRDAALFIIIDGLKYAQECRVNHNGKFQGFTCDPKSNKERPDDGYLSNENDRLFFTWTACETINDMSEWRNTYLNAGGPNAPPTPAVNDLKASIEDLEATLRLAAEWCKDRFLASFEKFEAVELQEFVREITQVAGKQLDETQEQRISEMATSVQHAYHLSQYAAIRSLVPESVSLQEVRTIMERLHRLVSKSILISGLDQSDQPDLFRTLTRRYSLGSIREYYSDDAWYPLVVRSLSGLLSRTLKEIGRRFSRTEVLSLTLSFRQTLEDHVTNLISRRASGNEDSKLWSFAANQPYVLYASQRTIFALMQYAAFLTAVDTFQRDEPDDDKREEELSMLVARKLSDDLFRPIIRELLKQAPEPTVATLNPSVAAPTPDFTLPEEPWAASVIRTWLREFTAAIENSQVKGSLAEKANWLALIRECVEKYEPSKDLPDRKRKGVDENFQKLKDEYKKICNHKKVGEELLKQPKWGDDELTPILFEHLFRNCVQRATGSIEDLSKNSTELWKLIKDAIDIRDNIKNLDPTGVP